MTAPAAPKPAYAIRWRLKLTDATGSGEPAFWTRESAEEAIAELNYREPDIEHWIEP